MICRVALVLAMALTSLVYQPASIFGQSMSRAEVGRQWNQAIELEKQRKYEDAAAIYERILPSAERIYGPNGTDTASILTNLGLMYNHLGQHAKAEPLYRRG